jgi:hypothetical protein
MKNTFVLWEKIFKIKNFDTTQDRHIITSKEIKEITQGGEARLLAKMDTSDDLPPIFKQYGYIILPIQNGTYAIVKGDGFHLLEPQQQFLEYQSRINFPLTTAGRGLSEMQYIDYAVNSGALEKILGINSLYPAIRGREFTRPFKFIFNQQPIETNAVQIEVDLGLEGEQSIVLIEGKVGTPKDFIIRQLYYPYRHFSLIAPEKKIIPLFFTYEKTTRVYNFWIYTFTDNNDYNSLKLQKTASLKITTQDEVKLTKLTPLGIIKNKQLIPQANNLDKIIEFIFKVHEGINDYKAIAEQFKFDQRQSSYYREAAEALNLITKENGKYYLTPTAQKLIQLPIEQRNIFFTNLLLDFNLIKDAIKILQLKHTLSSIDFEQLIQKNSTLSGTTIRRRAESLKAWFVWIAQKTGMFEYSQKEFKMSEKNGN